MERHITVGVEGHVDHGKTSPVRRLTGIDTDRLKEEKQRGLTIEPGIALLPLSEEISAKRAGRCVGPQRLSHEYDLGTEHRVARSLFHPVSPGELSRETALRPERIRAEVLSGVSHGEFFEIRDQLGNSARMLRSLKVLSDWPVAGVLHEGLIGRRLTRDRRIKG